jgi:CRISPR/Cas system CMR subunit Cmr6 (Cas7 group RAMP superfamily)
VDTVGDVQDLAAALFKLIWQKRFGEVGVWIDLVLTGIGFIPEFGSAFKGVFKLILKEGTKFEDIAKYLKHLGIDDAAGWLRKLSNNLDQYGDMIKKGLTHQLDGLSNFLQEFKKSLSTEQAAKIDELLKQIDEAKKRLPEEVDKVIAELKRRIDEILGKGIRITRQLTNFTQTTIDQVIESSRQTRKGGQITEGKRALEKKIGHARAKGYKSAFEGVPFTQENAEKLIRDILVNPKRPFIGDKVIDAYDTLGRGVRFDRITGNFIGFLEEALAKP